MKSLLHLGLLVPCLSLSSALLAHTDQVDLKHHAKEDVRTLNDKVRNEYGALLRDKEVTLAVENIKDGVELKVSTPNPEKAKKLQNLAAQMKLMHAQLQRSTTTSSRQATR